MRPLQALLLLSLVLIHAGASTQRLSRQAEDSDSNFITESNVSIDEPVNNEFGTENAGLLSWIMSGLSSRFQVQGDSNPTSGDLSDPSSIGQESDQDSLPKDEINFFIYDTLKQRILADGTEQEQKIQPKVPLEEVMPMDESDSTHADSSAIESSSKRNIPIAEALRIVQSSGLTDCVKRVICELSCNLNAYGMQGRKVFTNLVKLEMNHKVKEDTSGFKGASQKGLQLKQSQTNCERCHQIFANCRSQSSDLVAVSAMFDIWLK